MAWTADNSRGAESLKVKYDLVPYTRGTGLDLGCGSSKPFPHFIGIDNNVDARLFGAEASARQLTVPTCERLSIFADGSMDFVFSSHLLEHIEDYKGALKEWWRVIKTGGYLCLYLPHKDFYPNIGTAGSNPDHKHDFLPSDIIEAMHAVGHWDLVVNEDRNEGDEYSFYQVYRKSLSGCRDLSKKEKGKTCAVIRYGAYGDLLQTASVLPGLKAQGYRITFFCTPRGYEAISNDPNIDDFVIQDEDQVPNHELGEFFVHLEKRYDKVVNMCETVEGVALPSAHRAHFHWPHAARHAICNVNYVELQHKIAGVPYSGPEGRFYPTPEELDWAKSEIAKASGPVVAWSLSGSAAHKVWPHVDTVLARLMDETQATVVFLGGHMERALNGDWNHPRIWTRMGDWTIRQSLAFAQQADVVVGPETGVLNAVASEPMAKVLFLSHSSKENLTRDWVNTLAMEPKNTSCYPCHRLHLEGWKHCNRHEQGNAVCQVNISPEAVYAAIADGLRLKERVAA